jgi:hypothetical protein
MACKACSSEFQRNFPVDLKIYFDARRSAAPAVFRPELLICLDCGFAETVIPDGWNELQALRRAAGG